VAVALSVGLMASILWFNQNPTPAPLRDASPGFGWAWSFDYRQALPVVEPTREPGQRALDSAPPAPEAKTLRCVVDKPLAVGDIVIVYRGKTDRRHFRVDTIIPALDPSDSYSNHIAIAEARRGFSLAGKRFVLRDIGRNHVKLQIADR
jgi:hypothetical protein